MSSFNPHVPHMIQGILQSHFFRNVLVVMSGTAAAQAVGYALMPVITRLFTPTEFGHLGTFNAVLVVISSGVTLQYSQALILPKEESEAVNLFAVSMLSALVITILCAFGAYVFSGTFLNLMKAPGLYWILWILPFGVLVHGLNQTLQAWCVRHKAFKRTSLSQVIRSLTAFSAQVCFGLAGLGSGGLIGGALVGDGFASINLARSVLREDRSLVIKEVDWQKIKHIARAYADFPIYASPQAMLNAASQGIPLILLSHFYGIAVAGHYALSVRVLQVPLSLMSNPLRQVLFQRVSEAHNSGSRLYPLFLKTTGGLMAICAVPVIIAFVWGPTLFSFVFGAQWLIAGDYSRWLILWVAAGFCNVPSTTLARILRQQRKSFFLEVITLISRLLTLLLGGYFLSSVNTIILFSLLGLILNLYLIAWIWKLVKQHDNKMLVT